MKFKIGKSKIEGKGLIVKEPIREGELIGLAHIDNKPTKVVGMFHNHSEEPTAASVEMGNKRYLFALRELNAGDEITTDYRKQPELEQPEDFQKGGQMTPQKDGYRTYSPYKDLPYIDIDSNVIDTDNLAHDGLVLIGDNGTVREVANNSGNVTIPGANVVREIPYNLKRGGLVKMPKPSKKGLASKAYTRSLDGTNKLFTESYLFEKPKSRKNKIFDPSAKYYQDGGGVNITKLTPEEEAQFQKFYFTLPDNLMDDDPSYDIRGYWNSEGKPESFNYDQPKEKDGYYHAYSINGNTGEYLKAPTHPTFQHAVHEDRKIGYRPVTNVYGRNIATENPALIEPEEQSFLNNTSGPRAYQQGGVPMAEYGMPMGTGISQNYMGRTKSFYQTGGRTLPKPRSKNYDPLYTIKPQVAESAIVKNLPKQDKKVVEKAMAKKEAERKVVAQKIQANPLLTQAQKNKILLDPRKLDENVNLAYEKRADNVKQVEPQSTTSRAWEYITNPMTALEYEISGGGAENMPHNINQMRMAGIDPGVVAGRNLVGNTLNTTVNLFDAGDKVVRNLGEGNYGTAALEGLRFLPGARMTTGLGKQAANISKSAIQNTYKINPWAVKEAQETMLVRARPVGQDPYINMAEQLKAKQAAGEPLSWWQKNLLNPQTNPQMASREKYFGQWFADNPSDLDFYINPETRNFADDAQIEILKARMPKSEATKYSVKNFEDAKTLSNLHDTEYILPKDIVQSLERFSVEDLGKLQSEYKKMNTPHWLKGYKEVPKPGTKNIVKAGSGGMDMSRYEIKNPDYFTQLLDTYTSKQLSPSSKKFYKGLIESVKKQDGIVTERQYQELQRLKTGNFNYGKKAYQEGGYVETELTPEEIKAYRAQGYIVEEM